MTSGSLVQGVVFDLDGTLVDNIAFHFEAFRVLAVLYALVKEHLGAFLEHAREAYDRPLPKYVVDERERRFCCE